MEEPEAAARAGLLLVGRTPAGSQETLVLTLRSR